MSRHPHQALISTSTHLVTASHSTLSAFPLAGGERSTSTPHSALVRLLAFHAPNYLISTGEDKKLVVSTLPGLEVVSSRELNKRANSIAVTPDGTILVGDKFGDVYSYPLLSPLAASPAPAPAAKDAKAEKATPILGHVSMLNAVVFLPASTDDKFAHPAYVVSGDRDEHVRVSRYPRGEIIDKFLWGSKRFVASLLHLASPIHGPLILSAGGDPTLQLFSLLTGATLSRFPVESLLLPHVVVAPLAPFAVTKTLKLKAKKEKEAAKAAAKLAAAAIVGEGAASEMAESTPPVADDDADAVEEGEEDGPRSRKGPHAWKDGVTTGLAIVKLVEVPHRGVLVLAAGSTAILFVPFSLIIPAATPSTESASLLDLGFSAVDIVVSALDPTTFHVALDLARPSPSQSKLASEALSMRTAKLSATGALEVVAASEFEALVQKSAVEATKSAPLPVIASLYPVLSFLVGGSEDDDPGADEGGDGVAAGKKKNKKRPLSPSDNYVTEKPTKIGKRAEGRAVFQQAVAKGSGKPDAEGEVVMQTE